MGFEEKRRVFRLEFDGDYEGLVVKITVPPMGTVMDLEAMVGDMVGVMGKQSDDISPEEMAVVLAGSTDITRVFLENLVEWNVERDGVPVPADEAGLRQVSSTLGRHVVKTWWEFVGGDVPAPKDTPSNSGKPSLEASLPMEPLSPSRAS